MINFVKFSCDCIGTPPDSEGYSLVVKVCDRQVDEITDICAFERRCMMEARGVKAFEPVPMADGIQIMEEIRRTYRDGLKYREIKKLLS